MRCRVSQMYKMIVRFGLLLTLWPAFASAQDIHDHTSAVSGVPQGVPYFCARPTVTSIASGLWSDSKIWSTSRVPSANDKVLIANGHSVTFDSVSDAKLNCI